MPDETDVATDHMTTSRDAKRRSTPTSVPLYSVRKSPHLRVTAQKTPYFTENFVKFNFIVLFIALTASCSAVALAQEKDIDWGSAGAGYLSQLTEGTTGNWTSTHGWYVLPTFNINKQVGVFADFANLYGKDKNIHVEFYGVFHGFGNKTRLTPFIFTGPGYIRASSAGTISHSLGWCVGGGLTIPLTRRLSFEAIPVEYVVNTANGNVGNNIDARAGFAITFPKKRSSEK